MSISQANYGSVGGGHSFYVDKSQYVKGTPIPVIDTKSGQAFTPNKAVVSVFSTGDSIRILVFFIDFEAETMEFVYLYNNQYQVESRPNLSYGAYFTASRNGATITLDATNTQANSYLNTGRFTLEAFD